MALSLRLIIGASTALTVLIVAATTLAITYTVSVAAVRDAGERLAESITDTVRIEVHDYFDVVEQHLFMLKNWSKTHNFVLPPDDPLYDGSTELWGEKYASALRVMNYVTNFTYSSASIIFDDGSLCIGIDSQVAIGYYANGCQTWRPWNNGSTGRRAGDVTITNTYVDKVTKEPWDTATRGPPPDFAYRGNMATGSGYLSVQSLTGGREACMWFPPAVDTQHLNPNRGPRFILYGLCTLFNASNVLIGQASIGRYLDGIPQYLQGTAKTANTQLVVIDSFNLLLGSSLPGEQPVTFHAPGTFKYHDGCISNAGIGAGERVWGCRVSAADYAYAPLQDAVAEDSAFTRQPGRVIKFGKLAGENYYYISQRIPTGLQGFHVNLLLFMPEADVLGDIVAGRNLAIGVTVAVFVVAISASFVLIGVLLAPVDDVARRMYLTSKLTSAREQQYQADGKGLLSSSGGDEDVSFMSLQQLEDVADEPLKGAATAEVKALQHAYTTMDTAIKSFTKYVPKEVVKELMATNQMCEISMRPLRCSMLFTDIAGFTSICERVPPHILSTLVRVYFERMSLLVMGHGGVIDKFIGDCIMAVWGAPQPIDHQELRSTVCARMLTHEASVDPLKGEFAKAGEELAIRVGVATGEVLAGNMGSRARMNYTVIGDDVNLASRLEGLNKQWGTTVMVSEETAEECADHLVMRYVISIAVVGKSAPVKVFEVLGVDRDANTEALGKVTSEASEQQTLAQATRVVDDAEMAARYGHVETGGAAAKLKTTGWLLRHLRRKVAVSAEEKAFARAYGEAIALWDRGELAGCAEALRALATRSDLPSGAGERLSVRRVLEAAEAQLRQGPVPAGWTGVWTASEK